jgi:hypothetical protein
VATSAERKPLSRRQRIEIAAIVAVLIAVMVVIHLRPAPVAWWDRHAGLFAFPISAAFWVMGNQTRKLRNFTTVLICAVILADAGAVIEGLVLHGG